MVGAGVESFGRGGTLVTEGAEFSNMLKSEERRVECCGHRREGRLGGWARGTSCLATASCSLETGSEGLDSNAGDGAAEGRGGGRELL